MPSFRCPCPCLSLPSLFTRSRKPPLAAPNATNNLPHSGPGVTDRSPSRALSDTINPPPPGSMPDQCAMLTQTIFYRPASRDPAHPQEPASFTVEKTPTYPADQRSASHGSLNYQHPTPQHMGQDMPIETDIFSLRSNFVAVDMDGCTYSAIPKNFMEDLLKETIPGAAFNSSARDPPPRCHPGTRLLILKRCKSFIANCSGREKICLVVGHAGVGKSAIMQNIAESPDLQKIPHASVFFSVPGRSDGSKVVPTISYQLAAKSMVYRQLIASEIARDPTLFQSKMKVQFEKLIAEPFIHHLQADNRLLVIIDGLDECNDPDTQRELLLLISNFCIKHPSSPIVWLIASRPEKHIISFFSRPDVEGVHKEEKILIETDEARADVERYLRDELKNIQGSEWPDEQTLWKLANASGGLFAFADTAVRYIGDSSIRRPAERLSIVLEVIDQNPLTNISPEEHPMARLDALYFRILSKTPPKGEVGKNSRAILLALASGCDWALYSGTSSLLFLSNWLGMTAEDAYAVLDPLCSVFHVPSLEQAHREVPRPFHKSIVDHLSDFSRSQFSRDIKNEAQKHRNQRALRISKQAPHGVDFGDVDYKFHYGTLARRRGTKDRISLTWPANGGAQDPVDNELKLMMYKTAVGQIVSGIEHREQAFQTESCIRLLITRFESYSHVFPYDRLRELVFDVQRRGECMKSSILKEVPLKAIDSSNDIIKVKFRYRCQASHKAPSLPVWELSCNEVHEQDNEMEDEADEVWTTTLWRDCPFCLRRLAKQRKALPPDHPVSILFTSTGECCVELDFEDLEDGDSKWTYWFWISLSMEERMKYGSIV